MIERPTLDELRRRVHKDRHREIGNWLARRVGRPSAVYGTWLALRVGLTADQVTAASLLASILGSIAIATGTRAGFVGGVVLAHLAFWLDHVDGQLARWRGSSSLDGVYLDYLMHHVSNMALGFGLGYGLASSTGEPLWTLAGFAIAMGWAGLSLHNDCRYKAFFQRLKRGDATYRVEAAEGLRAAPAPSRPRRGRGAWAWPLFKACESHVVLLGLTAMAALALASPTIWSWAYRGGVLGMAVLAPTLAAARVARSRRRGAVEAEFQRWFQPEIRRNGEVEEEVASLVAGD